MMEAKIKSLKNYIAKANNIVVLTGAGVSTNCGIPDFRGPGGLYSRKDIPAEKLFDISTFNDDPSIFYSHIGEFIRYIKNATPSRAHRFIKQLENEKKLSRLITQNIDGLHRKAGNLNAIDIHGNFDDFFCMDCLSKIDFNSHMMDKINNKEVITCGECGGTVKPSVVFFGEPVIGMDEAITAVQQADLLIVMGTSLVVYPVAQLPEYLNNSGRLVILNGASTPYDNRADIVIHNDIDDTIKSLEL